MNLQLNHVDLERLEATSEKAAKGGGWLSAIAKAMGKAMGMQAARVVNLAEAISQNAQQRDGTGKGKDAVLAAEAQALNAQFAAASQELSYTSNTFSTGIKALGEASTTLARKQ
jgi:hypothetical protein